MTNPLISPTFDLVLRISQIVVPPIFTIITIIIAFFTYNSSKKRDKKSDTTYSEQNRPEIVLSSITLFPDTFEVYVGRNVNWWKEEKPPDFLKNIYSKENIRGKVRYIDIVRERAKTDSILRHKDRNGIEKKYMLINLCDKKDFPANIDDTILTFDALNIKLEFKNNSDKIEQIRIKRAYSMQTEKINFDSDIKIDVKFPISGKALEIPVAYAVSKIGSSSLHLDNIYNFAKEQAKIKKAKEPPKFIDFFKTESEAGKYIAFVETAYLLECITIDDKKYYYSLFLELDKHKCLVPHKIRNGDEFFKEKLEEATKKAGKKIVQEAENIDFKF